MRRAGLLPSALYFVRPDGHVALADPLADPERLQDYLSAAGITAPFVTPGARSDEPTLEARNA
jgi:hypothetical protein